MRLVFPDLGPYNARQCPGGGVEGSLSGVRVKLEAVRFGNVAIAVTVPARARPVPVVVRGPRQT